MVILTCYVECILLVWLVLVKFLAGITITATPSNNVRVNEVVTLTCELNPNPIPPVVAKFFIDTFKVLCTLEPQNGKCKDTKDICLNVYNASCPTITTFSLRFPFPQKWNGISVDCSSSYNRSENKVNFTVTEPVRFVTLEPTPITVIAGQLVNLTCSTSYCNPPATIRWYKSLTDVTSKSKFTTDTLDGLVRTTSSLLMNITKADGGKDMYCTASNLQDQIVESIVHTITVYYKPEVTSSTPNPFTVKEGGTARLECEVTTANPDNNVIWKWYQIDSPNIILSNGPINTFQNIQRNMSGSYRCSANNSIGISGIDIFIDVQYPPIVNALSQQNIVIGRPISVTCSVNPGNPNSTTFYWTKEDNSGFKQEGATLQLINAQKYSSGTYRCTAKNNYNNGEKGSDSQTVVVNVLYPPIVNPLSQWDIFEGRNLSVTCSAIPGNPNSTAFYWTKVENSSFKQGGSTLQLTNIQRNSSGSYRCTAENDYNNGEKGTDSQSMDVNVLYKPEILVNNPTLVNESEQVTLIRQIVSNPLSNVSWYNGSELLTTQQLVENATILIRKATCTDTKNFTLVASNIVQKNVTALVELIVNCRPRSYQTTFTHGVTDTTGINFSTTVIAYPEPLIELEYDNGTVSDQMMKSILINAVNNFTIHISQAVVNQSDFGVYHIKVWNFFGEVTINVNVIPQKKPNMPENIEIFCESTRVKLQWKSSFNGGDPQLFTIFASNGQQSDRIPDRGENIIHSTFVQHLQPTRTYVFYVSAQNSHGFTSSENVSCTTLAAESSEQLPIIVGSAAAGGLTLAVIVIIIVFLFRRYTKTENQAGKSQRFENDLVENESIDDDGLKDNILYVSADPRENEKHEAAVYAAVNKKDPTSNDNSNVYAEVKKNGIKGVKEGATFSDVKAKKGFFKKDGKVKKEKRQKRKQEVADVYENSDDIAMTAHPDNVYSNTKHNNNSAKEQRGYKNKDGLLYVEVQFDTKAEQRNPVIHGDDEKTDYATVEFPVPSSSLDRE